MRRSVRRTVLVALAFVAPAVAPAAPAAAQEEDAALYKSDLVRLLTGRAHTQEELARLVRRRCLGFEPTDRDLRNFRMLGAGAAVLEAIRGCAEGEGRTAAPAPAPPPPPPPFPSPEEPPTGNPPTEAPSPGPDDPPSAAQTRAGAAPAAERSETELTLFVSPRRAKVRPGEEVEVTAEVTAGAAPASQLLLALREGSGEAGLLTVARTDAEGRAVFRVAAGPEGVRRYSVEGVGREVRGAGEVVVEVAEAGAPSAGSPEGRTPATGRGEAAGAGETSPAGVSPPAIPDALLEDPRRALEEAARLSRTGRYGEADRLYREMLRRYSESVEARVGYAYHLARVGRHGDGEARLGEIPAGEEGRPDVLKARGFLSLWTGDPEAAEARFRQATERAPDDAEAWRGLGRALSELGREEEAREAFRRATEVGRGDRPRDAG